MRLGAPLAAEFDAPADWIRAVAEAGYGAAFWPLDFDADEATVQEYAAAARAADLVIAEIPAWGNPIDRDPARGRAAIELAQSRLDLAERVGACCCVNISGTRGNNPYGPSPENLTEETFELIVDTIREIVDAVNPTATHYALEMLPWAYPYSPDSYLRLIEAVDRPGFAVSLDPTNIVASPSAYFENGALIRECFAKLGPHIKNCHAKDVVLSDDLLVHLEEVRPGAGRLDYRAFIAELDRLGRDVPLMLEHLPSQEEYAAARDYLRAVASEVGADVVVLDPQPVQPNTGPRSGQGGATGT